ncbi:glycosyltransferase family 2 protein [Candidatus Woesearchaeota archaeon]|nr:glycosyltransferase family 2 protein [Candidatus Woesearchaeota archaeon]
MQPYIIIPAFNEGLSIESVITKIQKKGYKNIVVVDDGSKDNTAQIASRYTTTLRHIVNRGQGASLQTGIKYSLEKGADTIITFDADGQHSPEDIPKLINALKEYNVDIALGSRFLKKNKTPLIRKLFLKTGAIIIRFMYDIKLTDSHNGLRALTRRAAETIKIKSNGMEHASEILEQIKLKKLSYVEVPVTIEYTNYSIKHGQSTLNAFRILFKMFIQKLAK